MNYSPLISGNIQCIHSLCWLDLLKDLLFAFGTGCVHNLYKNKNEPNRWVQFGRISQVSNAEIKDYLNVLNIV